MNPANRRELLVVLIGFGLVWAVAAWYRGNARPADARPEPEITRASFR